MTRQSFIYGAMVLLAAALINRIIGFIYQIIMIRLIQPEGIGLFNMVYPIYVLVLVVATAGIPLSISKLVAEETARHNFAGARNIFHVSLFYLTAFSLLCTAGIVWAAPLLLKYIFPNPKVYYSFLCLVPGIIIVSICSAFRGYFQGLQRMTPTAATQTIEQLVRITIGLAAAYLLLPRGLEYAAIGVSLGVVCGELSGFLLMLIIYFQHRPYLQHKRQKTSLEFAANSKRIFHLAAPITLTRFVATGLMSLEAILIPQQLQAIGLSLKASTSIYGQLAGIAETLLFTPTVITISLATALVPAISDAMAQNNITMVHNRINKSLRITILTGLPSAAVLAVLANEICGILFGYSETGFILSLLALGGPFLYFTQTTTGILQGLGNATKPFKNMVAASLFKIFGIYYFTGLWGIRGAAISLSASYLIMAVMNYLDLQYLTGYKLNPVIHLFKPFLAVTGMAYFMWQANIYINHHHTINLFSLIFILLCGTVVYLSLLVATKTIDMDDFKQITGFLKPRF
ncbi:stage V sporulation protein B [Desulfofarcimen acetoxidans DSM 771]|uniref:Stage V sporulation protein B n=1 Tax=Desulfofarcimen acetoxidans (strain ATCC 49208 / DSM 771 / KCTC 5769 / VKM B-1644 / 5575) TaxID=485916 RepID=C8W6F3_DESAS|nr:stage V sporulation protein B [Desulfofarcimen acetoxidans]ACV62242.1 stage V sporulation protein B [Desulfofarcimen acetoxidans DSM 771]